MVSINYQPCCVFFLFWIDRTKLIIKNSLCILFSTEVHKNASFYTYSISDMLYIMLWCFFFINTITINRKNTILIDIFIGQKRCRPFQKRFKYDLPLLPAVYRDLTILRIYIHKGMPGQLTTLYS